MNKLVIVVLLSGLERIVSDGEAAVIIYSRDNSCQGQEMIRAFSNECKQYILNDNSAGDYFRFECNKDKNTLLIKEYTDNKCNTPSNITTLFRDISHVLGSTAALGTCQALGEENTNYHSAQLFCGGISSINNPKSFFSTFETQKIMFKHYSNSDTYCTQKPSVIEMFAQRTCLYYPAMQSSVHTGVYAMFSKEVSEGMRNEESHISAQFFNNDQCRREGGVIGPPGGGIGHPFRRRAQMIGFPGEGGIEGPGERMPGEMGEPEGPDQGNHEPQPGHWAPSDGGESEILNLDNYENICTSSASAILGPTSIDASVSAYSMLATGTYFDFVSNSLENGEFGASSSSSSTDDAFQFATLADKIFGLVIWGFGGLAFGLTIFFVYASVSGIDLFPNTVSDRSNNFLVEAENDMITESRHSTHALLNQDSQL